MILGPGRRAAVQTPWRGQRDAIPRRWLSARGADELSCAAGLVAWRRGNFQPRTAGRVVRSFEHINRSPAQFNPEKLQWLNQQYLKTADDERLAELVRRFLKRMVATRWRGQGCRIWRALQPAQGACQYHGGAGRRGGLFLPLARATAELKAQHLTAEVKPAIFDLRQKLAEVEWESHAIT